MRSRKCISYFLRLTAFVSLFLVLQFPYIHTVSAQQDSVTCKSLQPAWEPLVGAALFSSGALVTLRPEFHNIEIGLRDRLGLATLHPAHFDNYLQFVPITVPFVLNIVGLRGEHNLGQTALLSGTSALLGMAIMESCKFFYNTERPDGSSFNSFPSGHTFMAVCGAEILRREYGNEYPWIAVAGYGVAAVVGFMRIYNNRHWASDVIGGAGVALLSVSASYALWGAGKGKSSIDRNEITNTYETLQ